MSNHNASLGFEGNSMPEWLTNVTIDDIPENFQGAAEEVGIPTVIAFMKAFAGEKVYFPKMETAFKDIRDHAIRRDWSTDKSPGKIGRKYGLTENAIRKIVNDHEAQLSLI